MSVNDASVIEYKCPCCAAPITYDGAKQKMACASCGNDYEVADVEEFNKAMAVEPQSDFVWDMSDNGSLDAEDGVSAFSCPSCGGEIVSDGNTVATHCPYCDSPAIMPSQVSGVNKPDFVIPFKLDKEVAKQKYAEFTSKKILLPKSFKSSSKIEDITGMYVPFWLFDCDTDSKITYRAETREHWSDSDYNYTRTNHYMIFRAGQVGFNKVPIDGSAKMDDAYMEAIEPFDYNELVPFSTSYLSGHLADKFDVSSDECVVRANERIKNSTIDLFRDTVKGYSTVSVASSNINLQNGSVKYALLPVWTLNTKYKDEIYSFAMNAQTGKFIGKLPISWGKFWGMFAGFSVVLGGIATFITSLF